MNAKDFRIGNFINYRMVDKLDERKEWLEISEIDCDDLRIFGIKNEINQDYQLIPLTKDWLLKFGYSIIQVGNLIDATLPNHRFSLHNSRKYNGWLLCEDNNVITNIEYVHQLQNLYFALTGAELVVS